MPVIGVYMYVCAYTLLLEMKSCLNIKLCFLSDCCDLAIDVSCLSNQEIFDKVILEIKKFYGLEE